MLCCTTLYVRIRTKYARVRYLHMHQQSTWTLLSDCMCILCAHLAQGMSECTALYPYGTIYLQPLEKEHDDNNK